MSRTIRDSALDSRAARLKLKPRSKPYWRLLESGLHLGYRKPKKGGGTWIARRYLGQGGYSEKKLGSADDFMDADSDGSTLKTFSQAQEEARSWWQGERRKDVGLGADTGPYTVRTACEDYLKHYAAKGGKSSYTVNLSIKVHILPALGDIEVVKLTTRKVRDWHHGLAAAPRRLRTSKFAKVQKTRAIPSDDDEKRSRKATANRILTVLKAALNHAYHERYVATADAWRAVKPFKEVDAPVIRYLSSDECRRLVNVCPDDLGQMVRAALLTGCRYGELNRLRCEDVNLDAHSIAIRHSKGGKARHVVLTGEGISFFSSIVAGRKSRELLLQRNDGCAWKAAQQTRPLKEACAVAKISPAIGFHVLRHTHASILAMKGVPMGVIAAQLGHADTRITEKHYAHLAPSYVADTIRAAFPDLGIARDTNVIPINKVG